MPVEDYASIARLYDPVLHPFLDGLRHEVTGLIAGLITGLGADLNGKLRVADLCCGTGRQAILLHGAGMAVTGVDLSGPMLDVARRKSPPGIAYYQADAARTGQPDAAFDAVLLSFALHELPESLRLPVLDEAGRLLRPGGSLVVLDYHAPQTLPGRAMLLPIRLVERLAGREHHANFRNYMAGGAACGLLERAGMDCTAVFTAMRGCVGAFVSRSDGDEMTR